MLLINKNLDFDFYIFVLVMIWNKILIDQYENFQTYFGIFWFFIKAFFDNYGFHNFFSTELHKFFAYLIYFTSTEDLYCEGYLYFTIKEL